MKRIGRTISVLAAVCAAGLAPAVWSAEPITQTAGRTQLGEFAPKFAEYNDDILFGQVWNRPGLSPHDRSMITVSTLVGKGIIDSSLKHHLEFAKANGVTRIEIAELLTHVGFYAGWPNAWGAFRLAKDVWKDRETPADAKAAFAREMVFPIGKPNDAYAEYFSGKSYLATISDKQVVVHNVTFEPGVRNNWHTHRAEKGGGQTLVCVAGRGWYQLEGRAAVQMLPGDVVHIPANVKHWHGAAADSWFAHLALEVPGEKTSNEWFEPVADAEYAKLR